MKILTLITVATTLLSSIPCTAGLPTLVLRETGEAIAKRFGPGAAGRTAGEITESAARAVARYGEECLPLVRQSGHAGFKALEEAGEKAPQLIKLHAYRGDDAVWIISQPRKLAIFLRHGDDAAEALLKHPGLADDLIQQFGQPAAGALNSLSRPGAQRLAMLAKDGTLRQIGREEEVLAAVARHGDAAVDFLWKHKGKLLAGAALAAFLANPEPYLKGVRDLGAGVAAHTIEPVVKSINWTLIIGGLVFVALLPWITRTVLRTFARSRLKTRQWTGDGTGAAE